MPRYFFHTHIGDDVVTDPDGRDLADPDAAWQAARVLALQLLQGASEDAALCQAVLVVQDQFGEVVLEFPLTEALVTEPVQTDGGDTHH